jgi:K+ transporter
MKKFWKILQGVGLATAGTILAQPEIITGTFSSATQGKVLAIIAIANAVLPSVLPRKQQLSGESGNTTPTYKESKE